VISRVLPFEEWHKLPEYMDPVLQEMRPGQSRVCVVEDENGNIIGRWMLYPALMAEDLWIDPSYRRKTSVARRLWSAMRAAASELGFARVVSAPMDDGIRLVTHPSVRAEPLPPMVTYPVDKR
jgi:hypothetical protein